jgi:hypothetical protein
MPINIIDYTNAKEGENGDPIDYLCDNEWEMPLQIEALEKWLIKNRKKLRKGVYVADLGFSPREGAAGGGCVITTKAMEAMLDIGIELYLSEYPPFEDE